jgi:hypothetical protein
MWKPSALVLGCLALVAGTPRPTRAVPIEYRISGLLSGDSGSIFNPVGLLDVPFEISIAADTDTAFYFGQIAGYGAAYVNDSVSATWTVAGFGTAPSAEVQVFALPGVATLGFGWNGEVFPLDTTQPAQHIIEFGNDAFALAASYGHLAAAVPSVPLSLRTSLQNPPGVLPTYTTSIDFPGQGPLTLKELKNLSYVVVAVPEPSTAALLIAAFAAIAVARRHGRRR